MWMWIKHDLNCVVRKPAFCICENKDADQLCGYTAKLISAFVFATRLVQSLYFLNPKFQTSSRLQWLYSPVCVEPGRKPRRPVFSQQGSFYHSLTLLKHLFSNLGNLVYDFNKIMLSRCFLFFAGFQLMEEISISHNQVTAFSQEHIKLLNISLIDRKIQA